MTVRWVINHFEQLPNSSRTKRLLAGDETDWGLQEHLLADIRDVGMQTLYFTSIAASKDLKEAQWRKIIKKVPKPIERPGQEPEPEEESDFLDRRQLLQLAEQSKKGAERRARNRR